MSTLTWSWGVIERRRSVAAPRPRPCVGSWPGGRQGNSVVPGLSPPRQRNTDVVADLVAKRVKDTRGRISAKRLLPEARAGGYAGSARNFRRVVARAKAAYRRGERTYRPWVPSPGQYLLIDWGTEGGLKIFCAVLAWSRLRFVRFATDERRET